MKTKFKSNIRAACQPFGALICVGALLLIGSSAPAQNLFVSCNSNNDIVKIAPGGALTPFSEELNGPQGLAFNSAGNLFVAGFYGTIYELTPGGVQSTFASGLTGNPSGLAFNGAGNL